MNDRRMALSCPTYSQINNSPFRRPQETDTLLRYCDFTFLFLCFLIRHNRQPHEDFPIILHPQPKELVAQLYAALETRKTEPEVQRLIHEVLMAILRYPSQEALRNQWQDPLTRFLIAFHLVDDKGTFCHVGTIPPNLTKIQWCLRATGAHEVNIRGAEFDNNAFRCVWEHPQLSCLAHRCPHQHL
jgi:hypothetical protein